MRVIDCLNLKKFFKAISDFYKISVSGVQRVIRFCFFDARWGYHVACKTCILIPIEILGSRANQKKKVYIYYVPDWNLVHSSCFGS